MRNEFSRYIESHELISPGSKILLAVSGGVDSMVMAQLFLESEFSFAIAHCNFRLRGESADADEELVASYCEDYDIEFHSTTLDIAEARQKWKKGTQETARKLRYDWFNKLCTLFDYKRIATAHHRDDLVETFLFNLIRGGGYRAWSSLQAENDNLIRPLLWAGKDDIRAFAKREKIPFREDASNAENKYSRNQLRNEVIPLLEQINPAAAQHIADAASQFGELEPVIDVYLGERTRQLVTRAEGKWHIDLEKWKQTDEKSTLLKFWSEDLGLLPSQIPQVIDLEKSQTGKFVETKSGEIYRERSELVFIPFAEKEVSQTLIERGDRKVRSNITLSISEIRVPSDRKTDSHKIALFDLEKLSFPLKLRPWREGDKFQPLGMQGSQKVSDLLVQEKVPRFEKSKVMVLESGGKIAWVVGFRPDHRFRITDSTSKVLKIEMS